MDPLTTKQRRHLKSLAHGLKPILQVGKEGVSETTMRTVMNAFNTHELFKVKVLDASPLDAREAGEMLAERLEGVHLVQVIGKTVVLYRPHPEEPEIKLPR